MNISRIALAAAMIAALGACSHKSDDNAQQPAAASTAAMTPSDHASMTPDENAAMQPTTPPSSTSAPMEPGSAMSAPEPASSSSSMSGDDMGSGS
ncbi:hypothetical protein [Oleiagrimonas sp. MCCC 1A03011]|uniref:Lipoprotein n=1 Tax=Oleiagrimonas citrea TaxID=1665687 RepID=A0A846ZJ93_9GAMM|nr:hypothetical protein [Oleiagrimonas sp. MCCC 1A03011]NKZ37628.1 hypothetical protein [Oleiagrimonas citrea]